MNLSLLINVNVCSSECMVHGHRFQVTVGVRSQPASWRYLALSKSQFSAALQYHQPQLSRSPSLLSVVALQSGCDRVASSRLHYR